MKRKTNGDNTFVKITNSMVYEKIITIEKKLDQFNEENILVHDKIYSVIKGEADKGELERERIKGSVNQARALALSAIAVAGYAVVWLWQWATR